MRETKSKFPRNNRGAFSQLASPTFLQAAWRAINRSNKKSFGSDGETIEQFSGNLSSRISELSSAIKSRQFKFKPLRGVSIPKDFFNPSGKQRPLRIPTITDRVVLKAIEMLLTPRLEPFHSPVSYAYRKNSGDSVFGTYPAIMHAKELSKEFKFVLEADIKSYFDNVDKEKLINVLFSVQRLRSLEEIIKQALHISTEVASSVRDKDKHFFDENTERGIAQGSALSPLLANLYLSAFDLLMAKNGRVFVRYADDIIVFTKNKDDAVSAFNDVKSALNSIKLDVHPLSISSSESKTKIREISKEGLEFVGYRIRGEQLLPGSHNMQDFKTEIKKITEAENIGKGFIGSKSTEKDNLITRAIKVLHKIEGKAASLAYCDDCQEIEHLNEFIEARYIGLFRAIGVSGLDPYKIKLLGVPNFQKIWKEKKDKINAKKHTPPSIEAIALWAKKNHRTLSKAFELN